MDFFEFLTILRMRSTIIFYTLFLVISFALVFSVVRPKTYKATATVVLNFKGIDPVTGMNLPALLVPSFMPTQIDIMTSQNVLLKVIELLQWEKDADKKKEFAKQAGENEDMREWLSETLLKHVDVTPSRESSILSISYTDKDPKVAAKIANAFVTAFQDISIQIKLEPTRQASAYLSQQIKVLHDNFKDAHEKLAKYQQDKGITTTTDNKNDVETTHLNDLVEQLVTVQSQSIEASSRRRNNGNDSQEVVSNALIQNLKQDLSKAESELIELSHKFGENHPEYIAAKSKVDKLHLNLDQQIKSTLNSVSSNARVFQQREGAIRQALLTQRDRVLGLNRAHDEQITVLNKEVENAQHAYENAVSRFNQTSLEGQSNQSDVALIGSALPPSRPTGSNIVLNVMLAIVLGSFLSIVFAMIAEFMDRRARTERDITELLGVPLLGTLNFSPVKQHRPSFFSRTLFKE